MCPYTHSRPSQLWFSDCAKKRISQQRSVNHHSKITLALTHGTGLAVTPCFHTFELIFASHLLKQGQVKFLLCGLCNNVSIKDLIIVKIIPVKLFSTNHGADTSDIQVLKKQKWGAGCLSHLLRVQVFVSEVSLSECMCMCVWVQLYLHVWLKLGKAPHISSKLFPCSTCDRVISASSKHTSMNPELRQFPDSSDCQTEQRDHLFSLKAEIQRWLFAVLPFWPVQLSPHILLVKRTACCLNCNYKNFHSKSREDYK